MMGTQWSLSCVFSQPGGLVFQIVIYRWTTTRFCRHLSRDLFSSVLLSLHRLRGFCYRWDRLHGFAMTSPRIFTISLRLRAAALLSASALTACSTISGMSPFSSNVPYSQDIKPTLPQPAEVEIPAFKPVPKPPKRPEPPPAAEAPPAPAAPAQAAPSAPPPPAPTPSVAAPAPASPPPAPQSSAPEAAPAPKAAATVAPASTQTAAAEKPAPAKTADAGGSGETDTNSAPQLPADHREFKDDGTYPSLARVPARPVNLPTFADAKKLETSLEADNGKAKTASPASPAAPSIDSLPERTASAANGPHALTPTPVAANGAIDRVEDKAPCLGTDPAAGDLATTIHFAPGSSAMTSADLQALAEAMPVVRGAKGTIRIFGHGDTDANAQQSNGRFDLAAARAGAVAQALAGFGIPVPKIAIGVACRDAATAGASVQLYAES